MKRMKNQAPRCFINHTGWLFTLMYVKLGTSRSKFPLEKTSCIVVQLFHRWLFLQALCLDGWLVKGIQGGGGLLWALYRAVGHSVSHLAELAQQDLSEEQVDPGVQDLVEGRQADGGEKEITVDLKVSAGRRGDPQGLAVMRGGLCGDHSQHQHQ